MIRAELLGLLTTTATKVAVAVAIAGLIVTQLVFVTLLPAMLSGALGPEVAEASADLAGIDLTAGAAQLGALSPLGASMGSGSIGIALVALALLGVLAGTSEDRHGGIVVAVLACPRRARLVAAKAAATALAAAGVGIVMSALGALTLMGTLAISGIPLVPGGGEFAGSLARGVLAVICLVLIGLSVGLLCRSQLAGVLIMLAILIAEPMVAGLAQLIGGGTAAAWTQVLPVALAQSVISGGSAMLPAPAAIAALLALTMAALAVASLAVSRRDV